MARAQHFVGTLAPFIGSSDESKIRYIFSRTRGHKLNAVPCDQDDGWIIDYLTRKLGAQAALEVAKPGDFHSYATMGTYRRAVDPATGRKAALLPGHVSMDRVEQIRSTLATYRTLRAEEPGRETTPLQISVADSVDLAIFTFLGYPFTTSRLPLWMQVLPRWRELIEVLRHIPVFDEARRREIAELCSIDADAADLAFQLESPAVLFALRIAPRPLRRPVARLLAEHTATFLASLPPHARMLFFHLCYGNLEDTELFEPEDLRPGVLFLNALKRGLTKRGLALPAVHLPAAYGHHAPPTDRTFYRPLRKLVTDWRLIAGVVDEHHPRESETALHLFEEESMRKADAVATACGQGRSTEAETEDAVLLGIKLA